MRTALITVAVAMSCLAAMARADFNQFWLAAQHDWGGKRGFFLTVGAEFPAGEIATLSSVRLTLGVGDGANWHFLAHDGKWELDRQYTAKAVITDSGAKLFLDGKQVAEQQLKFTPANHELAFNEQPSFLRGPADYVVRQTSLRAQSGAQKVEQKFDGQALPVQLMLLNPAAGAQRATLDIADGVTVEASFILERAPDLRALAPFIDRFGQAVQADWPGKVRVESQLRAAHDEEEKRLAEWGEPKNRDAYGGITNAGWTEQATGFYRTVKRDGVWWLITPDGNPCFYVGVCDIPALAWEATPVAGREYLFEWLPEKQGAFAGAWLVNAWNNAIESGKPYVALHTANLVRKFGPAWETLAVESAKSRAKALGFSGFGKWTPLEGVKGISDVAVLYHGEIPNLSRHPDIFDPKIREQWTELLRKQIEPRKNDPHLIGWSVGNEFDENIAAADIVKILAMDDDVPAKRAMMKHAIDKLYAGDEAKLRAAWSPQPPAQDIEQLRRFYADAYYKFIYETVKSIDPNHLYLGMWVTPNWWENEADWDLIAPHCDVIGYDFYSKDFNAEPTARLIAKNDKPVLCGEFSAPPDYQGKRGYGRYHVSTTSETEAAEVYTKWLDDAAKHPKCVGVFYFQYRDQPITGRGPMTGPPALVVGESFAFGLVDVTDRMKWDFVEQVREANLKAPKTRLDLRAR